jgi:hypothetical protein
MNQPQQPLDEQGEAHEALNSAVANYGPRILENPQMLGNVVTDLLPDLPREQSLLIAAAEAGVAADLSQHVGNQNLDPGTAVQLVARMLADKKAIDPTASMWVTTEYARALRYDIPAYVPALVPSAGVPPAPSVPPSAPPSVPPSVPPSAPQSVPQSVPPWSAPPWQSTPPAPPLTAQQSVPPTGGYRGDVPAEPWAYGPSLPGVPPTPPDNSKKNRGILIAAISAAAVIVIITVVAAAGHVFGGPTPTPSNTLPPSPPTTVVTSPVTSVTSPTPTSSGPSNQEVADAIANLVVGNGVLSPLTANDGTTATRATCDPRTVSNPPDPSTPSTASCDITYSDGIIMRQTVTVNFDSSGEPVSDSTNSGIQIG